MKTAKNKFLFHSIISRAVTIAFCCFPLVAGADQEFEVAYDGADSGTPLQIFAPDYSSNTGNLDYKKSLDTLVTSPLPLFKASTASIYNADRILHIDNRIGIGQGGGEKFQWYGIEYFKFADSADWLNFKSDRVIGSFDYRFNSQWMTSNSFGQATLKLNQFFGRDYGFDRKITLYRSKLVYTPINDTEVRAETSNDFSYIGWWTEQERGQIMALQTYFLEAESFSIPSWQLRTNVRETFFDDSNRQRSYDNLILKEIVSSPVHLKVGASGGWTEFADQRRGYWSPTHFEAYGVRAVANYDFAQVWSAELKYYYGHHQEKNIIIGHDTATEFTLQYRNSKGVLAKIMANYYDTDSGVWWRNDIGFNLEIPY